MKVHEVIMRAKTRMLNLSNFYPRWKKLSISVVGDSKQLRRVSRMRCQDIAKVVGVNSPAAFLFNSKLPCFVTPTFAMMQPR
jgi:hypothetical protein